MYLTKDLPTFREFLNEKKSLNSYLPRKERMYSKYFETVFHYLEGAHHERSIDHNTLVSWIEKGKKSGFSIEILARGIGTANRRVLHHVRKDGTTARDFNEFNSRFVDAYDNLQVETQAKIA